MALLACGALGYPDRSDVGTVVSATAMQYEQTVTYTGADAAAQRNLANTNNVGSSKNLVKAVEADAYGNASALAAFGNPLDRAKWDNANPVWLNVTGTTAGFANTSTTNTSACSVTLRGNVSLPVVSGYETLHYFRITNTTLASFALSLAIPTDWEIVQVTGLTLTTNTSTIIAGYASAAGTIEIRLRPIPPAPPGDNIPPFVNPGPDRTVPAGVPVNLTPSVSDNDPTFPYNATFWWTFTYNGTDYNLSGSTLNFTFWELGTYALTFHAVDRSGNGAWATINVSVDRPDKVAPTIELGPAPAVGYGELANFSATVTDNDPNFPAFGTIGWTLVYNGTALQFPGSSFSFTFMWPGTYRATLTAIDGWGNAAQADLNVTIERPDQEAPTVSAGPDAEIAFGGSAVLSGNAQDNDPTFAESGTLWWTFTYNNVFVNITGGQTTFRFTQSGSYLITLWASDAWGNIGSDTKWVVVRDPDLTVPTIVLGPARLVNAHEVVEFAAAVSDNDPDFPAGARFWWVLAYNGSLLNFTGLSFTFEFDYIGTYTLSFSAVDAAGNEATANLRVGVDSPDHDAPEVTVGADQNLSVGDVLALNGSATDADIDFSTVALYWWNIEHNGTVVNISHNPATYPLHEEGVYNATLYARDGWGNIGFATMVVRVSTPPPTPPTTNTNGTGTTDRNPSVITNSGANGLTLSPSLFPLIGLGIVALGAAALLLARRRSAEEPETEIAMPAAAATAAADTAPVLAALPPRGPTHVVEGLLILYKDGRLIHHQASATEAQFESPEVVGSMFTAVTEFIRDSFRQEEGSLSRLSYGQQTILLESSAHLYGAVIVYGEPDEELRETLRDALARIELGYAGIVERWNGEVARFRGIDTFVAPVFAATAGLSRSSIKASMRDRVVRLVSATEHYKGYIRLRVAVVNQLETRISNATITVMFNQNVLQLARVEPAGLAREGLTIRLGDIEPGERQGAIYYLDPQTCSTTNIEGIATYTDGDGNQHDVKMKPRREEIVCPVFFTAQHANPASMKRLVETTLYARDSKVYRVLSLPTGTGYNEVFSMVREALQRHHVILVRNLTKKDPSFDGRAWFYGQTKHSKSAVVIRGSVSEERRLVEFFVAVDSPSTLTGLLAEFNRSFTELVATRAPGLKLEPVLDDKLKGMLSPDEFIGPSDA